VISVVLCTYNRAVRVEGAVRAILDQHEADFELIVVDDGSVDETPAVLARIEDERLRVVRRPNGGLSKARNAGLAAATGEWVTFIDDDDRAEPGWLATFRGQFGPSVGIACCGATFVKPDGAELFVHHPFALGGPYGPGVGSWLAGTFAARTDLVRRAGGYLDGLGNRHQSELFIRLLAVTADEGLRMTAVDVPGVRIEAAPATARRDVNPRRLYDATRWILARHPAAFAGHPAAVGTLEGIAGINAARAGEWRQARRRLLRSLRARPTSGPVWGRLALACVPALGDRVWHRHGSWEKPGHLRPGVLDQSLDGSDQPRELFLSWGYRENPQAGAAGATDGPARSPGPAPVPIPLRAPVRRLADRLARRRGWDPVVEVGADGEVPEGTAGVSAAQPGLVLCAGVLERVGDPVGLLRRLAVVAGGAPVLVGAVDRGVFDPDRPTGPPADPAHRREWDRDQFELLLHSAGFDVDRTWRVPAGGSLRARAGRHRLHRRVDDSVRRRRSGMVFLARARPC
jgi:Glycosyl transferase family 2